MLDLVERLVGLEWRWRGARLHEVRVGGSRVWYAEFAPRPKDREALRQAALRSGQPAAKAARPPTLILLHGLGASSTSFYPVIPFLRRGYRLLVPDLPGYGLSRPPEGRDFLSFPQLVETVEKFLARIAPSGAYLAGNSMGGWIAAKLAARRPDLVRAMALLNPGGPALRAEDWVDFVRIMMAEEAGAMDEWLGRMFHRPPFAMRLLLRDVRRRMQRPSVAHLMASLTAEDFLSEEELAQVKSPAVLVWGEKDRLIPDGCRAFYLEKLKGVRYEPVPDCGHCPQLECPHRTADILLELPAMAKKAAAPIVARGAGRSSTPVSSRRRGGVAAVARSAPTRPPTRARGAPLAMSSAPWSER